MKVAIRVIDTETGMNFCEKRAFELVGFDQRLKFDDFLIDRQGVVAVSDTCGNMAYLPLKSYELRIMTT